MNNDRTFIFRSTISIRLVRQIILWWTFDLAMIDLTMSHPIYSWSRLTDIISIFVCYLTGSVLSPFLRSISLCGTGYQRKFSFQLNPPYVISDPAMYSNVSSLITSMMGHTTVFLWNTNTQVILAVHFHYFHKDNLNYLNKWVLSATKCPFLFWIQQAHGRHTSLYSNRCRHKSEGTSR